MLFIVYHLLTIFEIRFFGFRIIWTLGFSYLPFLIISIFKLYLISLEFRGRVYPCSPHLTHLSHDMARSLLCFANGKPLGNDGFNWLKLHVINLTGTKKKEPVAERLRYADQVMSEILDSADNPLTVPYLTYLAYNFDNSKLNFNREGNGG